jgi:hypothetical protein
MIKPRIADMLMARGAFKTGAFKLKLHDTKPEAPLSPFYCNLRNAGNPKLGPLLNRDYDLMGCLLLNMMKDSKIRIGALSGIPRAGEPFVDGIQRVLDADSDQGFRVVYLDKKETAEGRCIISLGDFPAACRDGVY